MLILAILISAVLSYLLGSFQQFHSGGAAAEASGYSGVRQP